MARPSVIFYALIILSVEKVIQHIFVTIALLWNIGDIRSSIAVDYGVIIAAGAVLAVVYQVSSFGLFKKRKWGLALVTMPAFADVVGEYVVQGATIIVTLSLVVAVVILVLVFLAFRQRLG